MHTAPLATRSFAWSGSGARCRYVNRTWPIRIVVHPDALSCVVLDDHLVTVRHRFANAAWHETDAIFENLDFLRHTDAHLGIAPDFWGEAGGVARPCRRGQTTIIKDHPFPR